MTISTITVMVFGILNIMYSIENYKLKKIIKEFLNDNKREKNKCID